MGRIQPHNAPADTRSPAAQRTLTLAVIQAAELLEIPQSEVASILGLSAATVSRMSSGHIFCSLTARSGNLPRFLSASSVRSIRLQAGAMTSRVPGSAATIAF